MAPPTNACWGAQPHKPTSPAELLNAALRTCKRVFLVSHDRIGGAVPGGFGVLDQLGGFLHKLKGDLLLVRAPPNTRKNRKKPPRHPPPTDFLLTSAARRFWGGGVRVVRCGEAYLRAHLCCNRVKLS